MCRTAPQCLSTCAHIAHHAWHATMRHAYFKISIQHMREHQNVVQTCMHALVRRSQHLLIALIQGLARPRSVWRRSGAAMHGRGPPVPVAQQRHDGRHQHDADYKGVGEHGKHNDEADLGDSRGEGAAARRGSEEGPCKGRVLYSCCKKATVLTSEMENTKGGGGRGRTSWTTRVGEASRPEKASAMMAPAVVMTAPLDRRPDTMASSLLRPAGAGSKEGRR